MQELASVWSNVHVIFSVSCRAEVHGTELLGIVAAYFDENTLPASLPDDTHALLLNVALAGLRALTEAEVCFMYGR